jgi:hypothetical protein
VTAAGGQRYDEDRYASHVRLGLVGRDREYIAIPDRGRAGQYPHLSLP